jgi:hypothetical protein
MTPLDGLQLWVNDALIGEPSRQILAIADKHSKPVMPWKVRPEEYEIPFKYRYDPEDEKRVEIFRRLAVLYAALDIHCYWNDGKQVIGVQLDPAAPESKAWSRFSEEAMEVILAFVTSRDWT